ncbi:acyl-CoA synthetase [Citromicrobium sp. RCC1885]|uniref:fatty acyl-AMP ligase n=1 Tax=unclassified Citromicrobium TaxID=2630544 RepID=UPI0006C90328|nr:MULTISPECIES: fatty acyl-AMP ligase [unclassified Citromicrobium]KPM24635.1 acyl-CoA synthetase [Citromicrobium sp. RCC1885]KPM27877.1 acyl-CoA synthetase [Citromicrobium sp. RCC1878]OAM10620.1 acyl-CoA synthetase [Citromicrobium sp. RCC1897]|tara:strand:+ start:2398 stop:4149 length:1752 start_codon:yes stop_codon:yes gene_type:complete
MLKETLAPTPNDCALPRRRADFATFSEAIDYAARSEKGLNFHDMRGTLERAYTYREMRADALEMAQRLVASGIEPQDRVALIAETSPEFAALFCACIYAGAWPVPLPLPTGFGGKDGYIDQLVVQLQSSDPKILIYPPEIDEMAKAAADRQGCEGIDWDSFAARDKADAELPQVNPEDICYLQYSSGSTRFPTGVAVTHKALLHNLYGHSSAMDLGTNDRVVSWLPWYHDMGLVGCFLSVIANQVSIDYLKTEHFARRPLAWLDLISRNQGNTLSYSPTFGYDICARRISSQSDVGNRFDLSRWRTAGNGADMIRPDVMQNFVNAFADAGFKASAFTPSYGLAEATLAVTVMPPGEGIRVELVEEERLSGARRNLNRPARYRAIVNCGKPLPDMEVEIRGEGDEIKSDHQIGKVWCRGPSIMHSYFRNQEATEECLIPSDDGKGSWLDTGDMGYMADGYLFIVGRAKDMIIINGKNHWPQDIEWAVEQLPGFNHGDIAAFSVEREDGEEAPAVLVHCRVSDPEERRVLRERIREKVQSVTGMQCLVELVPPRTLPRTSSGKLSRAKAKRLYLSGEIQPYSLAA